jgi:DNA-binding NtrC family response regulator
MSHQPDNIDEGDSQFSISSQILVIDDRETDRQAVIAALIDSYRVQAATSLREAVDILRREQIGVIVANAEVAGVDVTILLTEVARVDPAITAIVLTEPAKADTITKLVSSGKIFRLAMKPVRVDMLRLAGNAAMREHHRRLADPRVIRGRMQQDAAKEPSDGEAYSALAQTITNKKNAAKSPGRR